MNQTTIQEIRELPCRIVHMVSTDVLSLRCPQCGGALVVGYSPGKRKALELLCKQSCFALHVDGLEREPAWVAELGNRVETSPN